MLFLFQTTSVEKKCTIRFSFEACDGEQSTRTLSTALQSWGKGQSPALNLENPLRHADGSLEFEVNPAPGTVPFFKWFLHHETSKMFYLEKEEKEDKTIYLKNVCLYIYIYIPLLLLYLCVCHLLQMSICCRI